MDNSTTPKPIIVTPILHLNGSGYENLNEGILEQYNAIENALNVRALSTWQGLLPYQ